MSKGIPLTKLEPELVEKIWKQASQATGYASSSAVARLLEEQGYYNQYTGKPYTRAMVHYVLRRSVRTYGYHSRRTWVSPLIVTNPLYPNISKWLQDRYPNFEVVSLNAIGYVDVKGRDLFGFPPLAAMLHAKQVHWIYVDGKPVLNDIILDDITPSERISVRSLRCLAS